MILDPDIQIDEDQQVQIVLDRDHVHLFDTRTEDAQYHGLA